MLVAANNVVVHANNVIVPGAPRRARANRNDRSRSPPGALWKRGVQPGRDPVHLDLRDQLPPSDLAVLCADLQVSNDETTRRLTSLDIGNNKIGVGRAQGVAGILSSNARLRHLRLDDNNLGNSAIHKIIVPMASNRSLLTLSLARAGMTLGGCEHIAEHIFIRNRDLRTLDLDGNTIGAKGAAKLATKLGSRTCQLEELMLNNTGIGNVGAVALADALRTNRHLHVLKLEGNSISEIGGEKLRDCIVPLRTNRCLRALYVKKNNFNDATKRLLRAMVNNQGDVFRTLDLER